MAKKGSQQISLIPDVLTLNYTLAELPSSQHRAGLAGLAFMVRWLHRSDAWKQDGAAICEVDNLREHSVTLRINKQGLQALFNEVYGASWEEKLEYKPRKDDDTGEVIQPIKTEEVPDKDPKTGKVKIDKKTGQPKTKTAYYYHVVVPRGSFLCDPQYDRSSDGQKGLWIKLWRDTLYTILKAKDASRNGFKARANDLTELKDVEDVWKNLTNPLSTTKLAGSFYLGAQGNNPENIPFNDHGRHQFLLHFWFFVAQIYVPTKISSEKDKETGKIRETTDFWGYVIAIPDVIDLFYFCKEFPESLEKREIKPFKYLPTECVIDLPLEAALKMTKRLEDQLIQREAEKSLSDLVSGIDIIHAHRPKDDTKFIYLGRFLPTRDMANDYETLRNSLWSPTFRRQRLLNLVSDKAWYTGFDSLLCTIPYEQTMENDYFLHDVRESFKYEVENMSEEMDKNEHDGNSLEYSCEKLVLRLVRNYVSKKIKDKYQLEWKKVQATPEEDDYRKYKAKIAKSAFLDVRSRTEKTDFINYFVSTICSVSQYMNESDFENLTRDLYRKKDENGTEGYEKIRTLTMLALSANG